MDLVSSYLKRGAVQLFREKLNLPHITDIPQDQRRPPPILNLLAQPNKETTSVNNTTNRDITPDKMQFGRS